MYNKGKTFDICTVAEAVVVAYPRAFTPKNFCLGMFPLHSGIYSDDDFLSAYVTDRNIEKPSENITVSSENQTTNSEGQKASASETVEE
ncbi:hypothetical protein PR048_001470 [Dryococelus australis]|uniref:Uncharacterized protein n=1 Tax=Dryococelus australis TaxID=614101 RepID=A0ABQ9IHJ0_9NEOP|nr:hypothetical protein PR048_001470 [Dryococelus australis]